MLKVHVVHVGGHGYYLEGRDAGSDLELPGRWAGRAAPGLGLAGEVDPQAFEQVMSGCNPQTGEVLRQGRGPAGVAGFDLTFCAPKSVSLLHALARREIADQAEAGHHAAVADAGEYLSANAVGVRRNGGFRPLPSTGMVAGEFRHRVSRALDPHLHTHVVAANVGQGTDGAWSSLDGRRLFRHLGAAGRIYQARLRLELSERLGAGWEVRPSGLGDVLGVDPALRRLFSQRTAAIEEHVHSRYGQGGASVGHAGAFYATRPDKDLSHSADSLEQSWRQRAADFGFDLGELSAVIGQGRRQVPARFSGGLDVERIEGALSSGARSSPTGTVARRDLVSAVAVAAVGGASAATVDGVVDRIVASVAPDVSLRRAQEPRWPTGEVVGVVHERGAALVADFGREPGVPRSADRDGFAEVRQRVRRRQFDRSRGRDVRGLER